MPRSSKKRPRANQAVFSVRALTVASPLAAKRLKTKAGISAATQQPRPVVPPLGTDLATQVLKPGKERWPVKTGADLDVQKVNAKTVVPTTIDELIKAVRPKGMKNVKQNPKAFTAKRAAPIETTVWRLECRITAVKLEADGDYHLVLQSSTGETMIGEIPDPAPGFVKASSPFLPDIRTARAAVDQKILKKVAAQGFVPRDRYLVPPGSSLETSARGKPIKAAALALRAKPSHTTGAAAAATPEVYALKTAIEPVSVRITGVGFFDKVHGQMGVAANGIELHPVLALEFL
jgi:hypothetical protein